MLGKDAVTRRLAVAAPRGHPCLAACRAATLGPSPHRHTRPPALAGPPTSSPGPRGTQGFSLMPAAPSSESQPSAPPTLQNKPACLPAPRPPPCVCRLLAQYLPKASPAPAPCRCRPSSSPSSPEALRGTLGRLQLCLSGCRKCPQINRVLHPANPARPSRTLGVHARMSSRVLRAHTCPVHTCRAHSSLLNDSCPPEAGTKPPHSGHDLSSGGRGTGETDTWLR